MPKAWEQMTTEEKTEENRRDILKLFDAVNSVIKDVRNVASLSKQSASTLSEVSKALEQLEDRMPKAD